MRKSLHLVEIESVNISTVEFRRAVSAFVATAQIAAEDMKVRRHGDRDRARSVVDHSVSGLAALAFAQIPRVRR